MKPRILVLYYTQTGQLQRILESIAAGMDGKAHIEAVEIEPLQPFPFPWPRTAYFNLLPDVMAGQSVALKPLPATIWEGDYSLVILGYQPWFLHPSLPVASFLQSNDAQVLCGKPVVTVIGCRKMWLHAQEKVKAELTNLGAHLVGNIVRSDGTPGPVSALTSALWTFKGKKESDNLLPDAGISAAHIAEAAHAGPVICKHLAEDNLIDLQRELLAQGAVRLSAFTILAEKRRLGIYRYGAKYIAGKNGPEREKRVKSFKNIMFIYHLLCPVFYLFDALSFAINSPALLKDRACFRELLYKKGRI